jgi:hypothetical protein
MVRANLVASRLLSLLGVALLLGSLALVPQSRSLADDGSGGNGPLVSYCESPQSCENGCALQSAKSRCYNPIPTNLCQQVSYPMECGACQCIPKNGLCQCLPGS